MREYSAAELDLMAKAFERARALKVEALNDENLLLAGEIVESLLAGEIVESLVDGIAEAIAWGERDLERLVSAALSKAGPPAREVLD